MGISDKSTIEWALRKLLELQLCHKAMRRIVKNNGGFDDQPCFEKIKPSYGSTDITPDIVECERIDDASLEPMRSVAIVVAVTLEIIFTLTIASVIKVAHSGQ